MKRILLIAFTLTLAILLPQSVLANELLPNEHENPKFKENPKGVEVNKAADHTFTTPSNTDGMVTPFMDECVCSGGSYSDPVDLDPNKLNVEGIPLEYSIADGELVILERGEYHYYVQSAEQGYFNYVTGNIAKTVANGYGTFVLSKGINKTPYINKIFNTTSKETLHNYGGYAKTASSAMIQYKTPLWGRIASAPVPGVGSKEVIVYISKTGNDYTWNNRARFVVNSDNSITTSTWYVD
ncbi:hypothetical protein [Halobacillus massiliensis]|uniref:hypothetical protein n=1 Tax=Halobacillus massiliensis TaxID=1926286 RepID=UPI0009E26F18|nr:hypothetical protein [Halobacillus massiliensis]